jgi:hypothetical protein
LDFLPLLACSNTANPGGIGATESRNGAAVRNAILALPDGNVGAITATNERVFVTRNTVIDYDYSAVRPASGESYAPPQSNLIAKGGLSVYGGMDQNRLTFLGGLDGDSHYPLHAEGTRVVMYEGRGLSVYDTDVNVRLLVKHDFVDTTGTLPISSLRGTNSSAP